MTHLRRLIAAALLLACLGAFTVRAAASRRPGCQRTYDLQPSKRMARRIYAGIGSVTLGQLREMGHREGCQRHAGDGIRLRRYDRRLGRLHDQRVQSTSLSSGDLANVPGVPRAFAACVAFRESTDGRLSSNIYGITSRYPGSTVAQQKATFSEMYRQYGTAPWTPYDHCTA